MDASKDTLPIVCNGFKREATTTLISKPDCKNTKLQHSFLSLLDVKLVKVPIIPNKLFLLKFIHTK